jgi:hypothetical protein
MTKDRVSDSASVRAVTYVNVEQAPKSRRCRSRPSSLKGEGHSRHCQGNDPRSPLTVLPGYEATARRKRKPTQHGRP